MRARAWGAHARAGQPLHFHCPGHIWRPRAPGWLAGWLAENPIHMHAGSPECMQAALNAFMNSEKWLAASQPFCGPRMADMASTVKMRWLPGARMATPGARAQGAVAGDILWPVRARARVSRSKFHKIRAPKCQNAVKMGTRTVVERRRPFLIQLRGVFFMQPTEQKH